jgi:superkiller protein 3
VQLRAKHGPEEDFHRALGLLLPSSPLISLLQPLPPPHGAYVPFPSPVYPPSNLAALPQLPRPLPHVIHLLASLPLLLNLLIRQQVLVHTSIEAKVKAGRTRLGAGTEKDVRRNVEAEVLGGDLGMELVDLLREVSSHPAVEDNVRREVEVREFEFWTALVGSLS